MSHNENNQLTQLWPGLTAICRNCGELIEVVDEPGELEWRHAVPPVYWPDNHLTAHDENRFYVCDPLMALAFDTYDTASRAEPR